MKKIMIISIVSILIINVFTILAIETCEAVSGDTLYVGGTDFGKYIKIQEAIDDATDGDTVFVYNGIYHEHLVVDKSISLTGENKDTTIIDGNKNGTVVTILADEVTFTGFTVQNSSSDLGWRDGSAGIKLDMDTYRNKISNNNVVNNSCGIWVYIRSYDNIISENSVKHNNYGIRIGRYGNGGPDGNIVTKNIVMQNYWGIDLEGSYNNSITDNNISNNQNLGIYLYGADYTNITGNTVINNRIRFFYAEGNNFIENTIAVNGCSAIVLDNSIGNKFRENDITISGENAHGFYFERDYDLDNDIDTSNIINDISGILVLSNIEAPTVIEDLNIEYSSETHATNLGLINLYNCRNVTIRNCTIVNNSGSGVYLYDSSDNDISQNIIKNNNEGIYVMHYSSSNTITENTISDNTEFGIFVLLSADNIISKNLISNSDQGIYLFSASSTSSSNNLIFHNDFINNIQHAIDTDDNNIWDDGYPSGGNYWSNYTGSDNFSGPTQDEPGSDGIGDIPYNISDGGSQDRYPKMIPYSLIVDAFGPYAGIVNIPIQFNSSTLGGVPPYNWLWDFGDNTTSTDQKPTHIYNNPGEYIVKLTVTDSKNRSNGDTAQVTIKYMKVKTNGPYTGAVNVPIPFTGSISGGVLPYNWLWDFGDGNTNDEQNTTHTYTAKGNYTVTLTVIDDKGYTEIDTTSANVLLSTVWVDDDFNNLTEGWGYDHFAAVQDGINAVDPRGTIYVFNGTYYENVVISKTVNLIGENINNTIIDGSSQGDVISISADRVSISGFTIQNGQNNIFWGDMYIEMSYPTDYISPYVGGDGNGIEITSDYTRISGNILKNNDLAIKLNTGSSNTVSENILVNNTKAIDLSDSPYNKLINNTIDSYGITITSNDLRYWNTHTIKNNYVNGKPIYYFKNNNEGIVSSDAAQVILANCSNYIIQNNTISNVERGIQLFSSSYTTIYQNTITDLSWCGIYLIKSSNNNISKNILTSSIQGVYVYDSSNNEITKNNISNHSSYGIYLLFRSNNNILSDNKLTNNNYGMYLSSSHENDVTKNSITDQTSYGIYFSSSTHNSINENLIIRNSYGIYLTGSSYLNNISKNNIQNGNYGISLYSSSDNDITKNNIKNHISYGMYLTDSYYSNIYHNNFINNTQQAYDEFMNFWYNVISLVGNYWDDYNGSDSNNDGIGDTPYNISGGSNQDMYPLMRIYDMEREKATPGFELILMICGIALVLFWKRKRMN